MIDHGIKHKRSQELINFAYRFAEQQHRGQFRKYTGEAYIVHPLNVAKIVASVTDDCQMICAALLHDVIEDCGVTKDDLIEFGFGVVVAELVDDLSDVSKPEDGNRKARKELDRQHTASASSRAKTIKLADLIDNSNSILERDPKFSKVYMKEKALLLHVLKEGDSSLYNRALKIVDDYYAVY